MGQMNLNDHHAKVFLGGGPKILRHDAGFLSSPDSNGSYEVIQKLAGVAEGLSEIGGRTALECNQEFLNAVSMNQSINRTEFGKQFGQFCSA